MRNVSGGGARQEITDKSVVEQAPCPARCHGIRLLTGDSENIRSASPVRIAASVGRTRLAGGGASGASAQFWSISLNPDRLQLR